jgi:hypothetical protein
VKSDEKIKTKVLKRLRATTNDELVRWIDNIHTAIGMNVSETRKNLTPGRQDQVLVNIEDMREGAVSLLAALQVIEERLTKL